MKKILSLLLFLTFAVGAQAGSITIYNRTAYPVYLMQAHVHSTPPPGGFVRGESGSLLLPPGVTLFYYPTPGHLLSALTGTPITLSATGHYVTNFVFRVGGTSACEYGIPYITAPYPFYCSTYGLTFNFDMTTSTSSPHDQVIDIHL